MAGSKLHKPSPPSVLAPSKIVPAMENIISKFLHMHKNVINTDSVFCMFC